MKILAIETSCDETAAAVVELVGAKSARAALHEPYSNRIEKANGKHGRIEIKSDKTVRVLSNITATSSAIHAKTGGIIPEDASREQVKYIIPTITQALLKSRFKSRFNLDQGYLRLNLKQSWEEARSILQKDIDVIAVTYGPGLVGSLLVGVETAKTLSFTLNKPLIPVNHLLAHLFANFIQTVNSGPKTISFPFVGLIVSGGHTDLLLFKSLDNYKWLGGTLDDAAGEALDKIGRLLDLPYPAGPEIERRAEKGKNTTIKFKSPVMYNKRFDFSFSGLKAEVARFIQKGNLTQELTNEICFATQKAIIDVLVKKTILAAKKYNAPTILLGGGVSANQTLRKELERQATSELRNTKVFSPEKTYATDNAAMIGAYASLNYNPAEWQKVTASPDLYFA